MYMSVSRHGTLSLMLYNTLSSFSSFQVALLFLFFSNSSTKNCLLGTAFVHSALSRISILLKSSSGSKPFLVTLMFFLSTLSLLESNFSVLAPLDFPFSCNAYNFSFSGILSCIVGCGNKMREYYYELYHYII